MVEPEHNETVDPVEECLVKLANATGNAVLVLNADIGPDSFAKVVSVLDNIGDQEAFSLVLNSRRRLHRGCLSHCQSGKG